VTNVLRRFCDQGFRCSINRCQGIMATGVRMPAYLSVDENDRNSTTPPTSAIEVRSTTIAFFAAVPIAQPIRNDDQ